MSNNCIFLRYPQFFGLAFIVLIVSIAIPNSLQATPFTVSGVPNVGEMPWMVTALTNPAGDNIYPLSPPGIAEYTFALFDTGSTKVVIRQPLADDWGIIDGTEVNVRIDGLNAGTIAGGYPIGQQGTPGEAEAEVGSIHVENSTNPRTLIGAPVANNVEAYIDYTTLITRSTLTETYTGPDMVFSNEDIPFGADVMLPLVFGSVPSPNPYAWDVGARYLMSSLSFNYGSNSENSGIFLYDTASNVTLITPSIAGALGLSGSPDFSVYHNQSGAWLDGFYLTSITMAGTGGNTFEVLGAPVLVTLTDLDLKGGDALIGSNLFSQTRLLFDGKEGTLGIDIVGSEPIPEPSSMLLLGTGLGALGLITYRRRKK